MPQSASDDGSASLQLTKSSTDSRWFCLMHFNKLLPPDITEQQSRPEEPCCPKPAGAVAVQGKLAKPYDDHGKQVTEGVTEITDGIPKSIGCKTPGSDEFVMRGSLPKEAARWFKVLQTCEKGSIDWPKCPLRQLNQRPEIPRSPAGDHWFGRCGASTRTRCFLASFHEFSE